MAYRLPVDDVKRGLADVAAGQVKRLRTAAVRADATFQQRRTLKKLRALVQLGVSSTSSSKREVRRLDRLLRQAGRTLAPNRDRDARRATLDRLVEDGMVATVLERDLRRSLAVSLGARDDRTLPARALDTVEKAVAGLRLRRLSLSTVVDAAGAGYRAARRALKTANAAGTSEAFHDWRKVAQRHARHMQLLADLWPEDMAVRISATKALARTLGLEHDLYGFALWLGGLSVPRRQRRAIRSLRRAIEARCAVLRASAHSDGLRLFIERPGAFRRRLAAYARHQATTKSVSDTRGALVASSQVSYQERGLDGARH